MELLHAVDRHAAQIGERIEAVIDAADVHVVDVEQQPAIGALGDLAQEFPFGHLVGGEADVAGDVLQHQPAAEHVLHGVHAADDVPHGLLGERQRHQVVQVHAVDAGPAQVIGDPRGLDPIGERLHAAHVVEIQRIGAADRQRDAVQHDGIVRAQALEVVQRAAAGNQVVVGERFEPGDAAAVLAEQCFIVLGPQPEPEARVTWEVVIERRRRGGSAPRRRELQPAQLFAFALAASHSAFVISTTPWPLQALWPLHSFFAVLHAPVPLHAFTPSHFTFASSPAFAADSGAAVNAIAAAVASARPESFLPSWSCGPSMPFLVD